MCQQQGVAILPMVEESFSGWQEGVVREVEWLGVDSIAVSLFTDSGTAAATPSENDAEISIDSKFMKI